MKTSFIRFILLFLIAWGVPSLVASQKNYIVTHYSLNIFSEIQFYRLSLYISYL